MGGMVRWAESNAADRFDDPTPRRLADPPEPGPPTCTRKVGTRFMTSSGLSYRKRSISPPATAVTVTVTGTACGLSSCLRAVTVMVSG